MVWRTGLSGVPPDSVRCTRENHSELLNFENSGSPSAIIHRTVRCAMRSNGYSANGRLQKCTVYSEQCGLHTQSQSRRQKAHRTVNSDCLVHHRTIRWLHMSELQRSNPNGWVMWLAHQTVRCARRHTASPTATLVVGAINTPQPPHFKASKFSANTFNTRASAFNTKHN
jgi:hypothetical protein